MATKEQKFRRLRYLQLKAKSKGKVSPEKQQKIESFRTKAAQMREERPQLIKQARQEAFKGQSLPSRIMAGAGRTLYSTPGIQQVADVVRGKVPQLPTSQGLMGFGPIMGPTEETPQQRETRETFESYETGREGDIASALGEIGADIALLASPTGKAAQLGKLAKVGRTGRAAFGGLAASVPSVAVHQAQRVQEGKEVSPSQALIETGFSAGVPVVGSKVGSILKGKATQIIETATKLGKKIKGQKVMNPSQVKEYFETYSSWKGALGAEGKLNKVQEKLGDQFDNIMKNVAKGKKVDIQKAISDARKRVDRLGRLGKINSEKVNKSIDDFEKMTKPLVNQQGKIDARIAQNFKKSQLDVAAKFDKPTPLGSIDPSLISSAQAARQVRGKLTKEMGKEIPDIKAFNKAYSKMAEIRPFIQAAAERTRANRGLSMQDVAALSAGSLGMGGGAYLRSPAMIASSIIPFLASRGQKSPALAKLLWELGGSVEGVGTGQVGGLGMQVGRSYLGGR